MTEKLYEKEPYAAEFDAVVLSCTPKTENGKTVYETVLNQTLFFPEEGGQSPDKGTLGDAKVLDVQITGGVITHTLDTPLETGASVCGVLDWKHRFSNMQQHSGEHIFSGIVHRLFGYQNVGFHLSDHVVSMDFDGVLTEADAERVEHLVNEVIVKNVPITVSYPSKEELAQMTYRSKIEIEGQVRIVTIQDVDVCACCAPHVRFTGEIGFLKVMSLQRHRGGVRICMLCGFRALEAFREKQRITASLINSLTCNENDLLDRVEKLKEANRDYKYRLAEAKQKLMALKIAQIPSEQEHVILFGQDIETLVMRNTVNELMEKHSGLCGMFIGNEENGYQFMVGSANEDCTKAAAMLRETVKAKCGGSKQMIQGSVKAPKALLQAIWNEWFEG